MKLVIEKSLRRLSLLQDGECLFSCGIALGFAPLGHKEREGDGRTPQGSYFVCTRNDKSKFYLALGLSYPNAADAQAALARGALDKETAEAIASAQREHRRPPWDTPLGGAIMVHGGGAATDWTAGCIALENPDMDFLWDRCPLGTEVEILP